MKKFVVLLATIIVLAATMAGSGAVCAEVPSGAVAVVNGEQISREEFGNALVHSFGKATIGSMIDRMLVRQQAEKRGITISEEELQIRKELEVSIRIRDFLQEARLSPQEFDAAAQKLGIKPDQLRQRIISGISEEALRFTLMTEKLLEDSINISPQEVRDYFERTRGERYLVAHIQVQSQELARQILEKLNQNPDQWEELLIQHSQDRASVEYRGRLPVVSASSDLGAALSGMERGQVTLYRGDTGWHVIRLLAKIPSADEEYAEVRDKLEREMLCRRAANRSDTWLAELLSEATIVTNLSADPQERMVLGRDVAAYVNGEPLKLDEFRDVLIKQFGRSTISDFVHKKLIFQAAEQQGIKVTEEEVGERMAELGDFLMVERAARLKMAPEELRKFLKENGIEPEEFRDRLAREHISRSDVKATVLAEKAVADEVQVSEQELQEAYSQQGKERLIGREIVVESASKASRLYERILGGSNFRALVLADSVEPVAWLHRGLERNITSSHPYYKHLKGKELGEVAYFKLGDRYHIVRLVGKKAPATLPAFESMRDSILRMVRKQKARNRIVAWLEKLSAEATIEVDLG